MANDDQWRLAIFDYGPNVDYEYTDENLAYRHMQDALRRPGVRRVVIQRRTWLDVIEKDAGS